MNKLYREVLNVNSWAGSPPRQDPTTHVASLELPFPDFIAPVIHASGTDKSLDFHLGRHEFGQVLLLLLDQVNGACQEDRPLCSLGVRTQDLVHLLLQEHERCGMERD
jgi:hypothetical protein